MVPPALGEVRQLVFERVLQDLKEGGDDEAEPPVSQEEGLQEPAEQM